MAGHGRPSGMTEYFEIEPYNQNSQDWPSKIVEPLLRRGSTRDPPHSAQPARAPSAAMRAIRRAARKRWSRDGRAALRWRGFGRALARSAASLAPSLSALLPK